VAVRSFAGPYAIGLIKDKTGSLDWGLYFCLNFHAGVGDILDVTPETSSPPIGLSFAGPRPDDGHPTGNAIRRRNLGLKPLYAFIALVYVAAASLILGLKIREPLLKSRGKIRR
jgi:hypothetical protein